MQIVHQVIALFTLSRNSKYFYNQHNFPVEITMLNFFLIVNPLLKWDLNIVSTISSGQACRKLNHDQINPNFSWSFSIKTIYSQTLSFAH